MKPGDTAKARCEKCDRGPVRLIRKRIEDTSAGQDFPAFESIDLWICENCRHEQGGSFRPE
jgi:hypothetical protein